MNVRLLRLRVALYLLVILAAAACLGEPWMIALQAALGGFGLGNFLRPQRS